MDNKKEVIKFMDRFVINIVNMMKQIYDFDISFYDVSFLTKSIERRITATRTLGKIEYIEYLENNKQEALELNNILNNNFTLFFRDPLMFAVLERKVLPNIFARKTMGSEIRVWSAGCSSGQEAYSIAILLNDFLENNEKNIQYRIFATDISHEVLESGRYGAFNKNDIRDIKVGQLEKYFNKKGSQYFINDEVKKNISFSYYDLLDINSVNPPESIYGDFDIVICANVLFYYKAEIQKKIIDKLSKSVNSKGYLITGETEHSFVKEYTKFNSLDTSTSIFCKTKGEFKQ